MILFPLFFPPVFTSPTSKRTGHGGMLSRPPNSLKPVGQKNANSKVWGNKLALYVCIYIYMSCFNYGSKDPYILFLLITEKTDLQNSTRIVIFWDLSGYESQIAGLLKKRKKRTKSVEFSRSFRKIHWWFLFLFPLHCSLPTSKKTWQNIAPKKKQYDIFDLKSNEKPREKRSDEVWNSMGFQKERSSGTPKWHDNQLLSPLRFGC